MLHPFWEYAVTSRLFWLRHTITPLLAMSCFMARLRLKRCINRNGWYLLYRADPNGSQNKITIARCLDHHFDPKQSEAIIQTSLSIGITAGGRHDFCFGENIRCILQKMSAAGTLAVRFPNVGWVQTNYVLLLIFVFVVDGFVVCQNLERWKNNWNNRIILRLQGTKINGRNEASC